MASKLPKGIYLAPRKNNPDRFKAAITKGRRMDKTFDTVEEAMEWLEFARPYAKEGKVPPPWRSPKNEQVSSEYAVKSWLASYRQQRRDGSLGRSQQCGTAAKYLIAFLGRRPIRDVTHQDLINYMDHLRGCGLANSTIDEYFNIARKAFKYFRAMRWVESNPCEGVRSQGRDSGRGKRRHIRVADARAAVAVLDEQWRLPFLVQLVAGLRIGEVFGLQVADVDEAPLGHTMWVRRQRGSRYDESGSTVKNSPKNGRDRLAFVVPGLERLLQQHIERRGIGGEPEAWLFQLPNSDLYAAYSAAIRSAFTKLGITSSTGGKVSSHTLRTTFSYDCEEQAVDPRTWGRLMGHHSAQSEGVSRVTLGYAKVVLQQVDIDDALAKLGPLLEELLCIIPGSNTAYERSDSPGDDWITEEVAESILGCNKTRLHRYVREGIIERTLHRGRFRNRHSAFVKRSQVMEHDAFLNTTVSLSGAREDLGMTTAQLQRLMAELDIQQGVGRGMSIMALQQMRAHVRLGEEFRRDHMHVAAAAAEMGAKAEMVADAMARGQLQAVQSEGHQPIHGMTWLLRAGVRRFAQQNAATLAGRGYISIAAAATMLGVSGMTVRRHVQDGRLWSIKHGARTLVSLPSVKKLLSSL